MEDKKKKKEDKRKKETSQKVPGNVPLSTVDAILCFPRGHFFFFSTCDLFLLFVIGIRAENQRYANGTYSYIALSNSFPGIPLPFQIS